MADLFISHIQEEAELAEALMRFLRESSLEAFLSSDHWQVRGGERWFDRIAEELNVAKVVILLLSQQSVTRPWINLEAGWGWATKKAIMPVCFGKLTKGAMPRPYSDLQGLDLRTDYYDLVKDCYYHLNNKGLFASPMPFKGDEPQVMALLKALEHIKATL